MTTRSSVISGIGSESYVVGKALALDTQTTTDLIEGEYGVYKLVVTDKNEAITLPDFSPFTQTLATQRANQASGNAYKALKEKANIKDNRALFY